MRDYEEKSYYEIQLDNKQLILVFLAGVTVCVLIFILGVMVGKGKKETEMALAGRNGMTPVRTTQPDLKAPQEPAVATDEAAALDKTDKKKKDKATKSEKKTQSGEEYSFYDLDKPESGKTDLMPKDSTKAFEPVQEPVTETKSKPAEEPPPVAESGGEEQRYTVQVMATASKPKADQQLTALKTKGYTAFLDEDKTSTGSVYKVRVGKFNDSDSAKKLATRLKDELKLETWVAVLD